MKCSNCNSDNRSDAIFCHNCGIKLENIAMRDYVINTDIIISNYSSVDIFLRDGKYGLYSVREDTSFRAHEDKIKKIILQPEYDKITPFYIHGGFFVVEKNNRKGLFGHDYNKTWNSLYYIKSIKEIIMKMILNVEYDSIQYINIEKSYSMGKMGYPVFKFEKNSKYGLTGHLYQQEFEWEAQYHKVSDNEILLDCIYDAITISQTVTGPCNFLHGTIKKNGKWGFYCEDLRLYGDNNKNCVYDRIIKEFDLNNYDYFAKVVLDGREVTIDNHGKIQNIKDKFLNWASGWIS